ncbi:MAG TPA: F0F1 ATP synthase subunit B', partial [Dongiaceae bacterium]|nr:F0F1 ATP synthase subunit B' [Dongiaceae bacterium]
LNKQADTERKQLEDRLAAKLADAEKAIATTRTTAMGNVRSIATDAASAIVQRLAGVTPDAKAVETAVAATLKG